MWKKCIAVAMAAVMAVSMVACGSKPAETEAAKTEAAKTETENQAGDSKAEEVPAESAGNYKIGLMISPLATREEHFRTAEMLMEEFGADKFVMDVYPENAATEQEVTISKAMNLAMDPDVKVIIFDSADVGTIAAVEKIKEERPDLKVIFGSMNEDVYEMAKVGDLCLSIDPELYGESVAQMAVDAGAEHFIFYSFARHMSNSIKIRYRDAMKAVCEANNVPFEEVSMPDPMGDAGVPGAQQFLIENIPSLMEQYGTKNIAYFVTVSTVEQAFIKSIVENGGIFPCHTDPSPFSDFAPALGLEIDEAHKFDAEYVTDLITKKLAEYDMNGRVGGWEKSLVRLEMEFLIRYAIEYCEGRTNEVDGKPDKEVAASLLKQVYGEGGKFNNAVNDTNGETYDNWYTVARDLYLY